MIKGSRLCSLCWRQRQRLWINPTSQHLLLRQHTQRRTNPLLAPDARLCLRHSTPRTDLAVFVANDQDHACLPRLFLSEVTAITSFHELLLTIIKTGDLVMISVFVFIQTLELHVVYVIRGGGHQITAPKVVGILF